MHIFKPGPGEIGSKRACVCDADDIKDVKRDCKALIREGRLALYYIEHDVAEAWVWDDDKEAELAVWNQV